MKTYDGLEEVETRITFIQAHNGKIALWSLSGERPIVSSDPEALAQAVRDADGFAENVMNGMSIALAEFHGFACQQDCDDIIDRMYYLLTEYGM